MGEIHNSLAQSNFKYLTLIAGEPGTLRQLARGNVIENIDLPFFVYQIN